MECNNLLKTLFIFFCGMFFAVAQLSYFFMLESIMSSTAFTYFIVSLFWLLGIILGLKNFFKIPLIYLIAINAIMFYSLIFCLHRFPYNTNLFIIYVMFITISSVFGGTLFNLWNNFTNSPARFFFIENNGFLLGIILTTIGFIFFGKTFLLVTYAILTGILLSWKFFIDYE